MNRNLRSVKFAPQKCHVWGTLGLIVWRYHSILNLNFVFVVCLFVFSLNSSSALSSFISQETKSGEWARNCQPRSDAISCLVGADSSLFLSTVHMVKITPSVSSTVAAPYAFRNGGKVHPCPASCVSSSKHLYSEISPIIYQNIFLQLCLSGENIYFTFCL